MPPVLTGGDDQLLLAPSDNQPSDVALVTGIHDILYGTLTCASYSRLYKWSLDSNLMPRLL